MAYSKTTWVDRLVQFPGRFTKSNETSGSVTLAADPGTVTAAGTPLSAANLNNMENGIDAALEKAGGTMTGALTMPAGTAAAPTIKDVNDTDTGIFFPSAGKFGISTNGVSRLEVGTAGVVTIGGSNVGAKLLSFTSVNGSVTSTAYSAIVSFKWETAYAANCTIYFEVNGYSSVSGSTAYFELYNTTDAAQVVELTTTSNSLTTMITSSSISLTAGKTYTIRAKHGNASYSAVMLCGYLKIV
jgi:hypothetical protein